MNFAQSLNEIGLSSGPVYATGLMTGRQAAQAVADCKAQETIRPMTQRILLEATHPGELSVARIVEVLAEYYHSEYVRLNRKEIRAIPFEQ